MAQQPKKSASQGSCPFDLDLQRLDPSAPILTQLRQFRASVGGSNASLMFTEKAAFYPRDLYDQFRLQKINFSTRGTNTLSLIHI